MNEDASVLAAAPFDTDALEKDSATICCLDAATCITFANQAWRDFGRDNGAEWGRGRWTLGVCLFDAVPTVLRPFYEKLFADARASRSPIQHSYECSSPTAFRRFRMLVFPCESGTLLLAHSLSEERAHSQAEHPGIESLYRDANGILSQCSHCRRTKRSELGALRWDWVPAFVAHAVPRLSHGLCPLCARYYYQQ